MLQLMEKTGVMLNVISYNNKNDYLIELNNLKNNIKYSMESKRNILFDKLIKENANAYIKFKNDLVLIYTNFLDFEAVRTSMQYFKSGKMKFEIVNNLPVLLDIFNVDKCIFDIIYKQLITEITPTFESIYHQIYYIMLLEQLTGGNSLEIQEMIKSIKFDPAIYTMIIDYGFNVLNYVNDNITVDKIIIAMLAKYRLLPGNEHGYQLCKYNLKCKCHYDISYNCRWKHTPVIISDKTESSLLYDLSRYNMIFLGNKEKFYNPQHSENNYDRKLLSSENIIFDIIYIKGFAFVHNPEKFIDRDKYQYKEHDVYGDEILINGREEKFRSVSLFKPYNCWRCCHDTIFYHVHGN